MKHLALVFALACTSPLAAQMRMSTARPAGQIDSVYPFDITLRALDNTAVSSRDVLPRNGKPTVISFWLTTCQPCMMELSAYIQKWAGWQQESPFNLVAISTDWPDRFRRVGQVVAEKKFPFPAYWDSNREFKEVMPGGLNGLPQVFVFDKNGKLVWHHRKYYSGMEDALFLKIKELNAAQ